MNSCMQKSYQGNTYQASMKTMMVQKCCNWKILMLVMRHHIFTHIIGMWLDYFFSKWNLEISLCNTCICLRLKKSIKPNFPR